MATKIVNSLAGLPAEVTVKKLETHSSYQDLWVTFPEEERICPHCGSCHCIKIPAETAPSITQLPGTVLYISIYT